MPNIYDFPNETQTGGFYEFTSYANVVTDNLFMPMFLWIIFIITFMATKQFETSKAFTIASFITLMISLPLAVLNLVSPRFMYLFILMLGASMVWLKLQTGRVA